MDKVIIMILVINLIISLLFAISCIRKGNKWVITLLFLALPVLGLAMYFFPRIIMKVCSHFAYDRDSLVKRNDIESLQSAPNVTKELDIIPVEDAMAISSKQEKRELLLDQLKKDLYENYRSILPATSDEDSEAAHYVAAAKMQVHQQMHGEILELQEKIQGQKVTVGACKKYLSKLIRYINSGLLEKKETIVYKHEYCHYFDVLVQMEKEVLEAVECTNYLSYLIDLKRFGEVETFWQECADELKEETAYRKMLEMYYTQKKKDKFYECLHELEKSDISLSADGLMMLRFWIRRR